MFVDLKTQKFVEYALAEPTAEAAKGIFLLARRCFELEGKNLRLERLAKRAEIMLENGGFLRGISGRRRPQRWQPNFQTGSAKYFRHLANTIEDYRPRSLIERGADEIFALEIRNRLYRDRLDTVRLENGGNPDWNTWRTDYQTETTDQDECYCCGAVDCCTCRICREYLDLSEALVRGNHAERHTHHVA